MPGRAGVESYDDLGQERPIQRRVRTALTTCQCGETRVFGPCFAGRCGHGGDAYVSALSGVLSSLPLCVIDLTHAVLKGTAYELRESPCLLGNQVPISAPVATIRGRHKDRRAARVVESWIPVK